MDRLLRNRLFGLDESELVELQQPGFTPVKIHQQALPAWQALLDKAKQDGLHPVIVSGYRSFQRQLAIWQRKLERQVPVKDANGALLPDNASLQQLMPAVLRWSAVPGFSRHHWGSDFDIFDQSAIEAGHKIQLEPWEFEDTQGPCYQLNQWLKSHLKQFGFFLPYQNIENGVANEPWHISYHPIAADYQQQLTEKLSLEFLMQQQFSGHEWLIKHFKNLYNNYICNIAPFEK